MSSWKPLQIAVIATVIGLTVIQRIEGHSRGKRRNKTCIDYC